MHIEGDQLASQPRLLTFSLAPTMELHALSKVLKRKEYLELECTRKSVFVWALDVIVFFLLKIASFFSNKTFKIGIHFNKGEERVCKSVDYATLPPLRIPNPSTPSYPRLSQTLSFFPLNSSSIHQWDFAFQPCVTPQTCPQTCSSAMKWTEQATATTERRTRKGWWSGELEGR